MQSIALKSLTLAALLGTPVAVADILPHHGAPGTKVYKCSDVDANDDGSGPDQDQVDQFLKNVAYASVSTPSVNKLPNGEYRVCATFTR